MSRKLLLAAAGAVFLIAASASSASAEVNFSVNLYSGGEYPAYYPQPDPIYPYYAATDDAYDTYDNADCGYEYITVKKWNRYHDRYRVIHRRVWVCN